MEGGSFSATVQRQELADCAEFLQVQLPHVALIFNLAVFCG